MDIKNECMCVSTRATSMSLRSRAYDSDYLAERRVSVGAPDRSDPGRDVPLGETGLRHPTARKSERRSPLLEPGCSGAPARRAAPSRPPGRRAHHRRAPGVVASFRPASVVPPLPRPASDPSVALSIPAKAGGSAGPDSRRGRRGSPTALTAPARSRRRRARRRRCAGRSSDPSGRGSAARPPRRPMRPAHPDRRGRALR